MSCSRAWPTVPCLLERSNSAVVAGFALRTEAVSDNAVFVGVSNSAVFAGFALWSEPTSDSAVFAGMVVGRKGKADGGLEVSDFGREVSNGGV